MQIDLRILIQNPKKKIFFEPKILKEKLLRYRLMTVY